MKDDDLNAARGIVWTCAAAIVLYAAIAFAVLVFR